MSDTSGRGDGRRAIVDAHVHLFDHAANRHEFLERRDETFKAFVGDYSRLPRTYLLHDYLCDVSPIPQAMVAQVQFRDPGLEERLDAYRGLANVTPSASTSRGTPMTRSDVSPRGPTSAPTLPRAPASRLYTFGMSPAGSRFSHTSSRTCSTSSASSPTSASPSRSWGGRST